MNFQNDALLLRNLFFFRNIENIQLQFLYFQKEFHLQNTKIGSSGVLKFKYKSSFPFFNCFHPVRKGPNQANLPALESGNYCLLLTFLKRHTLLFNMSKSVKYPDIKLNITDGRNHELRSGTADAETSSLYLPS